MELTDKKTVVDLLERHSTKPIKSLGQNFLIDKTVLSKICSSADISKNDTVVEVGAGIGTLTEHLAEKAKNVITIEKDKKMIPILKETLSRFDNVKLVIGDVLDLFESSKDIHSLKKYKVVANLPYCVASQVIKRFLIRKNPPLLMVVMVQKEVAERICAKPPKMNMLAVSVQLFSKVEKVADVGRGSFSPSPKVTSSVIKITPLYKRESADFENIFFKVLKAGYRHPRKQLAVNFTQFDNEGLKRLELRRKEVFSVMNRSGIDPKRRAETLSLEEWKKLTHNFYKKCLKI